MAWNVNLNRVSGLQHCGIFRGVKDSSHSSRFDCMSSTMINWHVHARAMSHQVTSDTQAMPTQLVMWDAPSLKKQPWSQESRVSNATRFLVCERTLEWLEIKKAFVSIIDYDVKRGGEGGTLSWRCMLLHSSNRHHNRERDLRIRWLLKERLHEVAWATCPFVQRDSWQTGRSGSISVCM